MDINQFIIFMLVLILILVIVLGSMDFISHHKDKKAKLLKHQDRINRQQDVLSVLLDGISKESANELFYSLNGKSEDDVYLVFKLPKNKLSAESSKYIEHILCTVFDCVPTDKYLYKYFDYWIKDYVNKVMLPLLGRIK